MYAWECPAHEALTGFFSSSEAKTMEALEALRTRVRDHLRQVFDAHGVVGKRNRHRIDSLSTGEPSDYHPQSVVIVKEELVPDGVRIYANKVDGLHDEWRFTLAKRRGRWVLTRKETFRYDGRWVSIPF